MLLLILQTYQVLKAEKYLKAKMKPKWNRNRQAGVFNYLFDQLFQVILFEDVIISYFMRRKNGYGNISVNTHRDHV